MKNKRMNEVWKDVDGYENYYQVSNLGRVKGLSRVVTRSDGRVRTLKERILKAGLDKQGYMHVALCKNGSQKTYKIHKLAAAAFLRHVPNGNKTVVNHIDHNKTNNKVGNLELVSNRCNLSIDKWRHGKSSKYTGVCLVGKYKDGNPKWMAQITINSKGKYLGVFKNEEEASQAYQIALRQIKK